MSQRDPSIGDRRVFGGGNRVVVKIGSSSLTDPSGQLDLAMIEQLAATVAVARRNGRQILIVTSGAISGAMGLLGLNHRPRDLATQQAAASVGQGALLAAYRSALERHGLVAGQVLLTAGDMVQRSHYRNAQRTLQRLLELGAVPVINENDTVATDEIRFGDNDHLAAMVAHLVHADALILLSDVSGLFDAPPGRPGARLIPEVPPGLDLSSFDTSRPGSRGVGSGGMASKIAAARIAADAGVPVLLAHSQDVSAALGGEAVGTNFHVTGRRSPTRLLWLRHAARPTGAVVLDAGAVHAVAERRMSLLPAGVVSVTGEFVAGDPIDLLDEKGNIIGRGLVNFDSAELPMLLGRSTRDLAEEFGSSYEREVVHRDDLAVLVGEVTG